MALGVFFEHCFRILKNASVLSQWLMTCKNLRLPLYLEATLVRRLQYVALVYSCVFFNGVVIGG
jgi:hypothetical protein